MLMQIGGHYIYYEKNPQMQNYMINTRRQNGVTPSEMVEDRATKDFRSAVRQRMEIKEQSQRFKIIICDQCASCGGGTGNRCLNDE